MCTVSWLRDDGGYQLLCNRDEKLTRARAGPPRIVRREGVTLITPVDGDFGGTWIAVNEFGVTLCLLNRWTPVPGQRSRGLLVLEMASARSVGEAADHCRRAILPEYSSFTLVALEADVPAAVFDWDGSSLAIDFRGEDRAPLVSSSFDPQEVDLRRRAEYRRFVPAGRKPDAASLYAFHSSHATQPDAYSPCMHRRDARTVSFSWVKVARETVEFFYSPGPPCEWRPGEKQALSRVRMKSCSLSSC
jgi:hypothetical protein